MNTDEHFSVIDPDVNHFNNLYPDLNNDEACRCTVKPKNARPLCHYAYFSNGFARCFLGSIESNFFLIF